MYDKGRLVNRTRRGIISLILVSVGTNALKSVHSSVQCVDKSEPVYRDDR